MSDTNTKNTVNFYKKASFPWMIIIVIATMGLGVVSGWNLRGSAESDAKVRAAEMVTSLAEPVKKEQK